MSATSRDSATVTIKGETLLLHPQRAVIWPARRTIIVADTHFGKSAIFRHHGVAVPAGSDGHDRQRLTRLVRDTQAQTLIILGDFLHGPLEEDSLDARELKTWTDELRLTEIHVISGNHDRGVLRLWRPPVQWRDGELLQPPFLFTHDAERSARRDTDLFTMSGHVHPVVRLRGMRKHGPRVPIFWLRGRGLVLPSFGIFTGGYAVTPDADDQVFAVGPQSVVRFR